MRRTTTSPRRSGSASSSSNSKKNKKNSYPKLNVVPAPKPLDVLFDAQDVVRSLAIPPNLAVKVAENANLLYQQQQQPSSISSGKRSSSSDKAQRNKGANARSSLQEALENIDSDVVSRLQHANLVVSTFANAQLASTEQTLQQYVGLFEGAKEEAAQLEAEMQERDRDAVRVVDFLRRELEQKHIQQQKLVQDHKLEIKNLNEQNKLDNASLKHQLIQKDSALENLKKEVERLQGELDMVAEFRRERIQLQHEHTRHVHAEEELTLKFEREITSLKFQNLEDRLRLRAVENEMCDKFQDEVHQQASKLVDAKGKAIREENDQLRHHTMRLHEEVEDLANIVDEKGEKLEHTQREVELSLQTQGEYARRSVIQARTAKDAIEKVKQLQSELSAAQREAKSARLRDRQLHDEKVSDLQHKLDAAHASLVAHRRDLIKTRNLAKRIVAQRSELEQFFYDALEYVKAEKEREEAMSNVNKFSSNSSHSKVLAQHHPQRMRHDLLLPAASAEQPSTTMLHRRTMTTELKVLPDPVRRVVSARRDVGYRGDLDAALVPTESFNAHAGLHAQSSRVPPQGCFSSQSDFAVPRTSQFFITQKEPATHEYSRERTAAAASPTRSVSSNVRTRKERQILGVLSDHRRQFLLDHHHHQDHIQSNNTNNNSNNNNDNGQEEVSFEQDHQNQDEVLLYQEQQRGQQGQQICDLVPLEAIYPEMHHVLMQSAQDKVSNNFKNLSWYDKEKIISAMLHHLNRATLSAVDYENNNNNNNHDGNSNNNNTNSNEDFSYAALSSNQASVGDFVMVGRGGKNRSSQAHNQDDNFEQVPIGRNNANYHNSNTNSSNNAPRASASAAGPLPPVLVQKHESNGGNNSRNSRRLYDGEEDDPFPSAPSSSLGGAGAGGDGGGGGVRGTSVSVIGSQASSEVNSRAQTADDNDSSRSGATSSRPRMSQYFGASSSRGGSASSLEPKDGANTIPRKPQIPRPPLSSPLSSLSVPLSQQHQITQQQQVPRHQTPRSASNVVGVVDTSENSTTLTIQPSPRPATQAANSDSNSGTVPQQRFVPTPSTASKKQQ